MGGNVPLGYQPGGRILKTNAIEARTVETLYDLYDPNRAMTKVLELAVCLGLRSKRCLQNSMVQHRVRQQAFKPGVLVFHRPQLCMPAASSAHACRESQLPAPGAESGASWPTYRGQLLETKKELGL